MEKNNAPSFPDIHILGYCSGFDKYQNLHFTFLDRYCLKNEYKKIKDNARSILNSITEKTKEYFTSNEDTTEHNKDIVRFPYNDWAFKVKCKFILAKCYDINNIQILPKDLKGHIIKVKVSPKCYYFVDFKGEVCMGYNLLFKTAKVWQI